MIKVMHVIDSAGLYGAETMLLDLAMEQLRGDVEPLILSVGNNASREKSIEAEARRRGIPCLPYRMTDGLNLVGAKAILRLASERGMNVIHSHNYKANILFGLMPRRMRGIPLVATLHGWTAIAGTARFSRMGLYCYIDQKMLHRLDAVVVVNPQLLDHSSIKSLAPNKVHLIANGIQIIDDGPTPTGDAISKDLARFRSQGAIVLGAIGRLSHEKNFGSLIAAFGMLAPRRPELRAVILGDGPEAARLAKQIASAGLDDRVLLKGYVANAGRHMRQFDALVIPSLTEGLPMVLLEAMAASTPVIATDVGGISSALGGTGELVTPGDPAALAAAIERFISDRACHAQMARKARERVEREFSAAVMSSRYLAVYQRVLGR